MAKCTIKHSKLIPGDLIKPGSICHSNKTKDGYCIGNSLHENCDRHVDCDIELYCKQGKCVNAGDEGENCNYDEPCKSYLVCYNKTCKEYGLLKEGDKVIPGHGPGVCYTHYYDDRLTCGHGPALFRDDPSDPHDVCRYFLDGKIITEDCHCFFTKNGSKVCRLMMGDLENAWEDLMEYMKKKPKCHVTHKYAVCDYARNIGCNEYIKGLKASYQLYDNMWLVNVPECVKNWHMKNYWYPNCTTPLSSKIS